MDNTITWIQEVSPGPQDKYHSHSQQLSGGNLQRDRFNHGKPV